MKPAARKLVQGPDFLQDPFPAFRALREEPGIPRIRGVWWVVRHADCVALLKHPAIGREPPGADREARGKYPHLGILRDAVGMRDPPEHTRLRETINPSFASHQILPNEPFVRETVRGLIAAFPREGTVDLMTTYATPLPFIVISRLLGFPLGVRDSLVQWVYDLRRGMEETLPPLRAAVLERADAAARELSALVERTVAGGAESGILHRMAQAKAAGRMSTREIAANVMMLLPAGTQTTLQSIGNAIYLLLRHPEQRERLMADPTIADNAMDELLRVEPPTKCLLRIVKADLEHQGTRMKAGQIVCFFYNATNRDPAVFADPDQLDVTRKGAKHLAFSSGGHYCAGTHLAKLEVTVALQELFRAFPRLRLAEPSPGWEPSFFSRQLLRLPVTLNP